MGNVGSEGILSLVFFVLIIYFIFRGVKNRGIVFLALSKFTIDPNAEDQIIIEGRKTGLVQWILVQLKLGNTYKIHVKKDHISYSEDSAAGNSLTLVPIRKVASTSCGYQKPIGLLMIAGLLLIIDIIFLFMGQFGAFFGGLIVPAIFVVVYLYMKNFFISIETIGSTRLGFSFKRSYIENLPIETEKIVEAIERINQLVLKEE